MITYHLHTHEKKVLSDFSESRKPVKFFYIEINENFIF
jgi:hypothetical protein